MAHKIALVDGNNIAFGNYQQLYNSKTGLLHNSVGQSTTIIFGLLRSLNALVDKLKVDECIICWDQYGSKFRKKLWSEYKQARKKNPPPFPLKEYYEELDEVREHLKNMGIKQISVKGVEADDVIGYVAKQLSSDNKIVIVSNDKDYLQLADDRITIFRPITDMLMDSDLVCEKFGIRKTKDYAKILALIGDKDEVPGIYRLGEKTAIKILEEFNWSLKKVISGCDKEFATKKDGKKCRLSNIKPSRIIAYKLAKIRTKLKEYEDWEQIGIKKSLKKLDKSKKVKRTTIEYFEEMFEFNTIKLPILLKNIGVKLEKGVKSKKSANVKV